MPKFLETKLKSEAAKKGMSGKKAAGYVYGAMNNMGAMRGNKETAKGAAMDAKHAAKVAAPKQPKRTFTSESHSYDQARQSRPVVSRYKTSRA